MTETLLTLIAFLLALILWAVLRLKLTVTVHPAVIPAPVVSVPAPRLVFERPPAPGENEAEVMQSDGNGGWHVVGVYGYGDRDDPETWSQVMRDALSDTQPHRGVRWDRSGEIQTSL